MSKTKRSLTSSPPQIPAKRTKKVYKVDQVEGREQCYLDSESADVHFVFGTTKSDSASSERIPAHKSLLACDSDVFKAMFYGSMKEKGDIRLTDVTEAAFKEFLQFFYLTEVELSVENLADVMHLGHKYNVTNCIDVCVRFFKDVHNAENILLGLSLGILYDHSELIGFCERFIVLNTSLVMMSNEFSECDRQTLAHILNKNLFICSEVELFEACMAWVKAQSKQNALSKEVVDEHLDDLFYNIRFGAMTIQEFCKLVQKYDAVLSNDYKAITELIALPHIQQDRFNTRPRHVKWTVSDDDARMKFNREDSNGIGHGAWFKTKCAETTKFSTSTPLLMTGFTCSNIKLTLSTEENDDSGSDNDGMNDDDGASGFLVHVKIIETHQMTWAKRTLLKTSAKLGLYDSTDVLLPRPILIKPGYLYRIVIKFPGTGTYVYHSKQLKKVVKLGTMDSIQFHDCKEVPNSKKVVGFVSALETKRI